MASPYDLDNKKYHGAYTYLGIVPLIEYKHYKQIKAEHAEEAGREADGGWLSPRSVRQCRTPVPPPFDRWQQTLAGKRVLVVCHGGVIRMVLANVLGIPLERSFTGFAVPYACRSRIQVDQSEFGVFRSLISPQP